MKQSLLLILILIFNPAFVYAEEQAPAPEEPVLDFDQSTDLYYEKQYESKPDTFKPLSMTKGVVLGLIPINGLGLIYTGHRLSGFTLMIVEVPSVVLMLLGGALMSDPLLGDGAKGILVTGVALFGITYAIDAIATPIMVSRHNKFLKSTHSKIILPYAEMKPNQGFEAGITLKF